MGFISPYVIGLNSSEVVQVLSVFTFSDDKLKVLSTLKDTLLNASESNKQNIVQNSFRNSFDQQKAYQILANITSRFVFYPLSINVHSFKLILNRTGIVCLVQ